METRVLGAYILGETVAKTSLGDILKCLPLDGPADILLIHRLADELAGTPEAKTLFLRQAKQWASLRDLHALNLRDAWESDGALCYTMEYQQGRLLADVLERARQEGIPISPDQAVYLAERIAGALQSLAGQSVVCGCLSPERVLVTFEGEVKLLPGVLKDLQTTPLLASPLLEHYRRYLPPGQASGKVARGAADRYAVGAMLFEFLCQQPFCPEPAGFAPAERLEQAREGAAGAPPIPENLRAILGRCLLTDSAEAYADLAALKADLDLLVASGEYSPTTFNIAFLMHTLFRGEDEAQATSDAAFAAVDRAALRPPAPEPAPTPAPPQPSAAATAPPAAEAPHPVAPESATEAPLFSVEPEPSRKGLWIGLGAVLVVGIIAVLSWLAFFRSGRPAASDAQTQQQLAELARLKTQQEELAKKLQASEEEKQRLQAQIDTAKTADEKQRAQRALDETQRRMQAQQEEQRRLAGTVTQKSAATPSGTAGAPPATPPQPATPGGEAVTKKEAAAGSEGAKKEVASDQPAAGPQPAPASPPERSAASPASPPPATQPPAAPPSAQESPKKVQAGDFVPLWAVDAKPKQLNDLRLDIPSAARQNRVTGTIYVEVQIDETGKVTDAKVVKTIQGDYGMNEACRYAALRLRYSPALKDGVPVKTTLTFPIFVK